MPLYAKKPITVRAVRFDGSNLEEIESEFGTHQLYPTRTPEGILQALLIDTLEGRMRAEPGDWVVEGIRGELYPVKPHIFAETYQSLHQLNEVYQRRVEETS